MSPAPRTDSPQDIPHQEPVVEIQTGRFKTCKGKKTLFYSNLQLTCGSKGLYIQTSDRRRCRKVFYSGRMAYLRSKQVI